MKSASTAAEKDFSVNSGKRFWKETINFCMNKPVGPLLK